jgi:hypothetical protein
MIVPPQPGRVHAFAAGGALKVVVGAAVLAARPQVSQ